MSPGSDTPARVILGATSFADAEAAMGFAIALARRLNGELMGLLIEEETFLACSSGRGTQAVMASGGAATTLSPDAMRAAYRRDARAFRKRLEEVALGSALRWSFATRQGRAPLLLSQAAKAGDLVILGYRAPKFTAGHVVAVMGAVLDADTLARAAHLARESGRGLSVLARGDMCEAVIAAAVRLGTPARVIAADDQATLLHRLNRLHAAIVFLGDESVPSAALPAVIELARAPVVLPAGAAG